MNAFLGAGGHYFLLAALLAFPLRGCAVLELGDLLHRAVQFVGDATGLGPGTVATLGAGGSVLLVLVALAVVRQIASLALSLAVVAAALAWWAGWLS